MKNGPYSLVVAPKDYPGMRYRGRYAYEHHVVFWRKNKRMPKPGHVVHHRNDKKRDNRPSNLEEKALALHVSEHNKAKPIRHGTITGYQRGCRCEPCRASNRESQRRYRARQRLAGAARVR